MFQTTRFNDQICVALVSLGIAHAVRDGVILVDRTSMVQASPRLDEAAAYECVLDLIASVCSGADWVGWSGRTDDYLGIAVFDKDVALVQ